MIKRYLYVLLGYLSMATIALAQRAPDQFTASDFRAPGTNALEGVSFRQVVYGKLGSAFTAVYYILIAAAILLIVWGVVKYFAPGGDNEVERKGAVFLLTWGLISLVILISVVPVLGIILDTIRFV